MKILLQNLKTGKTEILNTPTPRVKKGHLLISTNKSLVSPGTEKMLVDFGRASLLSKAKQQPNKVKQVINKARTDGIIPTYEAVNSKLSTPISLGYSNVGSVIAIGDGVEGYNIGDRVVSNGCHAEIVCVPKNLCAKIPDDVDDDKACFVVISAIGLQGIRLAKPTIGERFVVIGLGLIGLITSQILTANGCRVLAVDINDDRLSIAKSFGVEVHNSKKNKDYLSKIDQFTNGIGVDGVIITTSTKSDSVMSDAANMCRKRGRVILIGTAGLNLSREDFYEKEISFQVSCSYGPGRYDRQYEDLGKDYPIGFVRWTENRNFQAILDLIQSKKINLNPLISRKIDFKDTPRVYQELSEGGDVIGIVIEYSEKSNRKTKKNIPLKETVVKRNASSIIAGFIGAGNYSSRFLMPLFKRNGVSMHTVVSESGLSGTLSGKKFGFENSSTDTEDIFSSNEINTVIIATRHDSHADLVCRALRSNKNVFVEKPLAIDFDGLENIKKYYYESSASNQDCKHLMVGFNRRFSPHITKMKELLLNEQAPRSMIMTMNAGKLPSDHWLHSKNIGGGRIVGEACHYIDLARYLMGSKIIDFKAQGLNESNITKSSKDTAILSLRFLDGSVCVINYFANGHSSYPKEKLEIFSDGKILTLENFIKLKGYGWGNFNSQRSWTQNKGQEDCIRAFLSSIETGDELIPIDELIEVAEISLKLADILRYES